MEALRRYIFAWDIPKSLEPGERAKSATAKLLGKIRNEKGGDISKFYF